MEPNWLVKEIELQKGEGYNGSQLKEGVWIIIHSEDRNIGEGMDVRFFVNGADWEGIRKMFAEASPGD